MVKRGTDYFLSSEQLVLRDYFDEDGKWLPRLAYEGVADGVATLDSNTQVKQPPNALAITNLLEADAAGSEFLITKGGVVYKATGNAANGPAVLNASGHIISRLAYENIAGGVVTLDLQKYVNDGSSVTNYGAVGDGTTDDTAAIQEAINTADVVVFPPGTYYITSEIVVNKPTVIVGKSAKIKAKSDIDILKVMHTNKVILHGLTVEGWANEESFTGYPGVQAGISIEASNSVVIDDCVVSYCSGPGIIITGKSDGEYYPDDTYNVFVSKTIVNANNQGITIFSGPHDVWIVNSLITNSITNGIFTDDRSVHDTKAYPPSSIVIANNILRGNVQSGTTTQAAIAITATRNAVVGNNIIVDSGQATSPVSYAHGILLGPSQSDNITTSCVVNNNIIVRPSRSAIAIQAATHNIITNNRILDPQYNAPAGANAAVHLLSGTLGSGSVQGADSNILQNNAIASEANESDTDYGVKIEQDCLNNIVLHDVYTGISALAVYDLGTDNRTIDIILDGQNTSRAGTSRPNSPYVGQWFFDTNLGYPIWWNGTDWVDATGTAVQ